MPPKRKKTAATAKKATAKKKAKPESEPSSSSSVSSSNNAGSLATPEEIYDRFADPERDNEAITLEGNESNKAEGGYLRSVATASGQTASEGADGGSLCVATHCWLPAC